MLASTFGPTGVPVSVIGQGTWHMGEKRPSLFAIPKATRPGHVRDNAGALDVTLTPEDLWAITSAAGRRALGEGDHP